MLIEIRHLSKSFQTEDGGTLEVLRDVSFEIEQGDIYGVIGMSGAGKSTMLRLIGLLDQPTEGAIAVRGRELQGLSGKEKIAYYKSIGTVFQGYNLLMQRTVAENIAFPLKLSRHDSREVEKRVRELLELVSLAEKANSYPARLSGGQKQRVAIARALANRPEILLCDEPTSALDSMTTASILSLLEEINRQLGVTIVIITHEIGVVKRICNKVAVLDGGRLVDNGPVEELLLSQEHAVTRRLFQGGVSDDAEAHGKGE